MGVNDLHARFIRFYVYVKVYGTFDNLPNISTTDSQK